MKKANRILAAAVSCALALSCSVSVLAETEETENTADSGYVSVISDTSTSDSSLYTVEEETTEATSTSNNGSSETTESETEKNTEIDNGTMENEVEAVTETEAEETGGSGGNISLLALSLSADTAEVGDFSVTGDTDGYNYEDNVLTISGGGEYLIAMANGVSSTEADRIEITAADEVTITIENINITSSSASPFNIKGEGNVNLILSEDNYLTSTNTYYAGLQKDTTANTLTISSKSGIDEDDTLEATGGIYGAGIGGSYWTSSGIYGYGIGSNITINSGTITAIGGKNGGAGIGGGRKDGSARITSGSNIVINGGIVTATAGSQGGAGIGGGLGGKGSDITINGGNVTATGGHDGGAGIGGGLGCDGSNIVINDGTVTATGSVMGGAGIGGGDYGDGSNITINGGTITVSASPDAKNSFAAGIGGGEYGNGNNITINNGTITVTSSGGACIGGGEYGDGDEITITGGYFLLYFSGMVQSSIPRAYIGRGSSGTTGTVTITGGFFGAGACADGELSITKTVDKSVARPGDTLTYEITVSGASADRNTVYGAEPADSYVVKYTTDAEISGTYPYMVVKGVAGGFSAIYVVDELPSGLTFVSASNDGGYSDNDNKVTWVIDTLSSGDSKTLTLVTTVD